MQNVVEFTDLFIHKGNYSKKSLEDLLGDWRLKADFFDMVDQDASVLCYNSWVVEVKTVMDCRSVAKVEADLMRFQTKSLLEALLD